MVLVALLLMSLIALCALFGPEDLTFDDLVQDDYDGWKRWSAERPPRKE